jgi:hypothetical protein
MMQPARGSSDLCEQEAPQVRFSRDRDLAILGIANPGAGCVAAEDPIVLHDAIV